MTATPGQMRAFQKLTARPDDVAVVDLPIPEPGPGEALIEVAACGVCGSDLHAARSDPGYETIRPPVVLGHECAGRVVAVDTNQPFRVGDAVVAVSIQGCGQCVRCHGGHSQLCQTRSILGIHHDGGLAHYMRVPIRLLVPIPDGLDPVNAALAEPLSVAVHAVLERSSVWPGTPVVVSGPGPIGLLAAQVALSAGAEVLVLGTGSDSTVRLPLAQRLGANTADLSEHSSTEAIRSHFGETPPHLWLEASGAVAAFDTAINEIDAGGQLTVIAQYTTQVEIFIPDLLRREITLNFSYAANAAAYATALRLLASDDVNASSFSTRYPLENIPDALTDIATGRVVKAVILPDSA